MKEKAIRKYNHIDVLTPMVYALNLSGCRLLVFAYIQGFCRDEASVCYSSFTRISETIGYARRTVAESITALIGDGYIYKVGTQTIDGRKVSGYRTYFYELMDRYDAGEDISPAFLKTRRSPRKSIGAQSAPVQLFQDRGAQSSTDAVHISPNSGAVSAIDNTMITLNDNLSESAQARADEEREFLKIFFLRNAGKPADELKRFLAWYRNGKKWTDAQGRKYETLEQRAGLAWNWDCKSGRRLPECEATDNFYKFLEAMYAAAQSAGDIDPMLLLDSRTKYEQNLGGYFWYCRSEVKVWTNKHLDIALPIKEQYIGQITITFSAY